jgi:hypothetical protein
MCPIRNNLVSEISKSRMPDIQKDILKDSSGKPALKGSIPQSVQSLISGDYRSYIVKKSERLASALYVVSGFMQPDEPMRRKLRTGALDIIGLSSRPSGMSVEGIEKFKALCVEMGALLTTARGAGLLSQMNAGLLSEEYALLGTFVSENSQTLREGKVLAFDSLPPPTRDEAEPIVSKGLVKEKQSPRKVFKRQSTGQTGDEQSDRKRTILSLVDAKGKISIKDAASLIAGVSEKTIQRELLAMVKDGLLLKEGERRWSTYRRAIVAQPVS